MVAVVLALEGPGIDTVIEAANFSTIRLVVSCESGHCEAERDPFVLMPASLRYFWPSVPGGHARLSRLQP